MTQFPSDLDSLTNPSNTDKLNSPSHSDQHINANDAIEAIQTKLGVDGSAITDSIDYKVAQNTSKTGITAQQASDITTNNAKISYTDAAAVAANTAKNTYPSADATKLAGIETGATTDQTNAEIKTAYEANADTNVFTDTEKTLLGNQSGTNTGDQDLSGKQDILAEGEFVDGDKTKLDGIEAGAEVNVGEEYTSAEKTKLSGVETGATADMTNAQIKTAYEANSDTNEFSDSEQTKLAGIEDGAEVNTDQDIIQKVGISIDGGGGTITTGIKGDVYIPYDFFNIDSVTLLADQSGSIVIDIWEDTYANYPPTDADSITASAVPTISSATKSQDDTLSGWTTTFSGGVTMRFNVDSCSTITRCTLILKVTVTNVPPPPP